MKIRMFALLVIVSMFAGCKNLTMNPAVTAVNVVCSPLTLDVPQNPTPTVLCTATVAGSDGVSQGVTWKATAGTLSVDAFQELTFTPPDVTSQTDITITATSVKDATKSGTATITLNYICPSLDSNVTWTSYSHFSFGNAGDDNAARALLACNWHIFEGHGGGFGETLQVASPNAEVVFAWAYQNFAEYRVASGWTGQTDRGAKIGDSTASFQGLYPGFVTIDTNHLEYTDPTTSAVVDAYFDQNGLLSELLVQAPPPLGGPYISP